MTDYTTQQASEATGLSVRRIQDLAIELGLGRRIGDGARAPFLLSETDLERIKARDTKRGPKTKS